ncbi:MAG: hypothetical protein LUQ65_02635, partial [Candidatus Helarchaeota archaeon]|nr:hypothetical protein [Candidatus Helarchaeota archaeon]
MNRRILLIALLFAILCTGTFAFFTQSPSMIQTSSVINDSAGKLDSKVLGDVEKTLNITPSFYDLEYVNGYIWAAGKSIGLFKLDPNTGVTLDSLHFPFEPVGVASDGTFFYLSAGINQYSTIYKYTLAGTYVANLSIPLSYHPDYDEWFTGLACHNRYLYAISMSNYYHYGFRINLDSWSIDKTFEPEFSTSQGLAYYDGLLWTLDFDKLYAFDPNTGKIQERIDVIDSGSGLAYDGTHFLMSNIAPSKIYYLDIPTETGEVWTQYPTPESHPLDIAWNGTYYYLADTDVNKIYKLNNLFRN